MLKKSVTPKQAVHLLNKALKNDYTAISALFQLRVYCNIKTAQHASIQVQQTAMDSYMIGLIGLLNGMFGCDKMGRGCIAMEYKGTKIEKFILLKK